MADIAEQDSNKQPHPTQAGKHHFPAWLFLILGPLIGVLLVLIDRSGVFEKWHLLNPPPSQPVEFVGVSLGFYQADPYILGMDGKTYFCDAESVSFDGDHAMSCTWSVEQNGPDTVQKDCQPSGVKFSGWKKPFSDVLDCTEVVMYGEFIGAPQVTFVITSAGELWYWAQENQRNWIVFLPVALILGLMAGAIGIVVYKIILALRKWQPTNR
jgi:hypothetical protein